MAKRRRKKPNIPQAAMEHARQEAGIEETPDSPEEESAEEESTSSVKSEAPKPRRRRRSVQAAQLDKRKNQGNLDAEYIADMLENPTKIVTEEELQEDYAYVIRDLRNMGVLAAVLFVFLIGISLVVL